MLLSLTSLKRTVGTFLIFWSDWFPSHLFWIPTIPNTSVNCRDLLIQNPNDSGILSLKDFYIFKDKKLAILDWPETIWSKDVPLSKSLLVWKIMHDKISTDEMINIRGIALAYMCWLCNSVEEIINYLFFHFTFSKSIWNWFRRKISIQTNPTYMRQWLNICKGAKSNQASLVIKVDVISITNKIWSSINNYKHNNQK